MKTFYSLERLAAGVGCEWPVTEAKAATIEVADFMMNEPLRLGADVEAADGGLAAT